jgi:hypothetical protein
MGIGGVLRGARMALAISVVSGSLVAAVALAEPDADPQDARPPAPVEDASPVPQVGLDALLRLPPSGAASAPPKRSGEGANEWRARFAAARGELESAEAALAKAQAELESMASGRESWQVTAPGAPAGSEAGPVSFSLRQEIRRQREAVEHAQRELDELRIQANLAGVPEDWTEARPAPH